MLLKNFKYVFLLFYNKVAHSSGNHGRALAWIARSLGLPCVIVCPTSVPECKLADIANLGASVRQCQPTPADRYKIELRGRSNLETYITAENANRFIVIF